MSGALRIVAFAALLAVVFAGAAAAGSAIDPDAGDGAGGHAPAGGERAGDAAEQHAPAPDTHDDDGGPVAGDGGQDGHDDDGAAGGHEDEPGGEDHPVRGLAVAEGGLRLVVDRAELPRGQRAPLAFRIVDRRGRTVRDFEVEHEKRMHLIVVRRDLTGFQHLHPEQRDDGSWRTRVTLPEAGSYRVFADFVRAGEAHTLASDLRVDGPADLQPLPRPRRTAVSDGGYDVAMRRDGGNLRFTITRDGVPVHVEPYLGAGGHLVVLREGDLAYLHVHPTTHDEGDDHGGSEGHDDSIGFEATFPTPGRYGLFLQFKHEGRVQTVAFTKEVKP